MLKLNLKMEHQAIKKLLSNKTITREIVLIVFNRAMI